MKLSQTWYTCAMLNRVYCKQVFLSHQEMAEQLNDSQKVDNNAVAIQNNDFMDPLYDQTNDPLLDVASKKNAALSLESYDIEKFKEADIEETFQQYCAKHKELLRTAQNKLKLGGEIKIGDNRRDINNWTGDKHESTLVIYTEGDKIYLKRKTNKRDAAIAEQFTKAGVALETGAMSIFYIVCCCCFCRKRKKE